MDITSEKYWKTGAYVLSFYVALEAQNWESGIVEVIGLRQRIAGSWILGGNVENELSATSSQPSIVGITMAEWHISSASEEDRIQI